MRQILHRSPLLILLFSTVAAMIALSCSTVAEFYTLEAVLPDFLSEHALTVSVAQSGREERQVTVRDLVEFLSRQDMSLIVYKNHPISNSKEVFLAGRHPFRPNIVDGRNFEPADFRQSKPVALVANVFDDRCFFRSGNRYVVHEGIECLVAGTYAVDPSRRHARWGDNTGAFSFINMAAVAGSNPDAAMIGEYIIDAGKGSLDVFGAFAAHARQLNPAIQLDARVNDASTSDNLIKAVGGSSVLLLAAALTVLLILLNVSGTTCHWIEGRLLELAVRMLSGGRLAVIRRMMLRDYVLIVTVSYGLGLSVAAVTIRSGFLPFLGRSVDPIAALAGYPLCVLTGTVVGWAVISINLGQSIVTRIRGGG